MAACDGAKIAPRTTTNPLTKEKITGMMTVGLYGLSRLCSRYRSTMAPTTVKKKNVYSPSPLKVRSTRKLPRRMYMVEITVERIIALIGASDLVAFELSSESSTASPPERRPTCPTMPKICGNQFMFAAATAIRPATNEFPSREPATTRQINTAATTPNAGPRKDVMAVLVC